MSSHSGPPSKRGRLEMYSPFQPMSPEEVNAELTRSNPNHVENKIILLTVLNAIYPVNVELVTKICKPIANPVRIVIFSKVFVQIMIEFEDEEVARKAKEALHSADIYPGSCTLKVEYAKTSKLNVKKNDAMTWDFTMHLPKQDNGAGERKVLFNDPPPLDNVPRQALFQPPGTGMPEMGRGMMQTPMMNTGIVDDRSRQMYNGMNNSQFISGMGSMGMNQGQGSSRMSGGRDGRDRDERRSSSYHDSRDYNSSSVRGSYGSSEYSGEWGGGYQGRSSSYQGTRDTGGSVLMLYGLEERVNCQGVFNLLCVYGDVMRVSYMKKKPGCAMVEMDSPVSADRVLQNYRNTTLLGEKLMMERSRKPNIEEIRQPHELPDMTPSYMDFSRSPHLRFSTEEKAMKNRIIPPSNVLHFYNVPSLDDDAMSDVFEKAGAGCPSSMKWFDGKPGAKSASGLLMFDSESRAMAAMVLCNHAPVRKPGNESPFTMKLCYSKSKSRD